MLNKQELATVLAALRYYQENGQGDPANRSDLIHNIATDDGNVISLNDEGISELCEKINCAEHSFTVSIDLEREVTRDGEKIEPNGNRVVVALHALARHVQDEELKPGWYQAITTGKKGEHYAHAGVS